MAESEEIVALRDKAAKCRRLAMGMVDDQTIAALRRLAASYDHRAAELERAATSPNLPKPPPPA